MLFQFGCQSSRCLNGGRAEHVRQNILCDTIEAKPRCNSMTLKGKALVFTGLICLLHAAYSAAQPQAGTITCWDLRKIDGPADTWQVNADEINSIDLLEDEKLLAAADDTGAVNLLSASSGSVLRILEKHENICSAVKFRPNHPTQIISAGLDCQVVVSDWKESGQTLSVFRMSDLTDPTAYAKLLQREEVECGSSDSGDELTSDGEDNYPDATVDSQAFSGGDESTGDAPVAPIRIASSLSPLEKQDLVAARAASVGLPLNLPMPHCLACSENGEHVITGLESGTVEVFNGEYMRLSHVESLCGHRRGVAAVLCLQETHVISGGNDCQLFLWELSSGRSGQRFVHSGKICALAGSSLSAVYLADSSPNIQVIDFTRT
ncbi:hypothetical protein AAHC03_026556 [Spirometra sp. Aus1]